MLAQTAGRFLATVGSVRVVDANGVERTASRGGVLNGGDTVDTGLGFAQIRLADGSLVSVRSNTEFTLEAFRYEEDEPSTGQMLVNLLRGSFRALTGLIGSGNPDGYRINTPHATIGIRGTDHETTVTLQAVEGFQPGTFDVVYTGATRMTTRAGFVDIGPSQAAFVGSAAAAPRVVPVPQFLRNRPPVPTAPPTGQGDGTAGRAPAGDGGAAGRGTTTREQVREQVQRRLPAAASEEGEASATARPLLINPLVSPIRPRTATATGATPTTAPRTVTAPTAVSPTRTLDVTPTFDSTTTLRTLDPSTTTLDSSTTLRTLDPSTTTLDSSTTLRTLDPSITTIEPIVSPTTTTTIKTLEPTTTTIISPTTTTLDSSTTIRTLEPTTTLDSSSTLKTLDPSTTTTIRTLEPTTTDTLTSPTLTAPLRLP